MDQSTYKQEKMVRGEELFCIDEVSLLQNLLHRSIGAITFKTSNRPYCGSGALISPYLILTAAHNIYDKQQAKENDDFRLYFGANGKISIQSFSALEAWRYPAEFKTCKRKEKLQWDYALLKLKQPVKFNSYLQICQSCPTCLLLNNNDIQLEIFGFPNTKQNYKAQDKRDKEMWLQQFGLCRKGKITQFKTQFQIDYQISTLNGQSGCPVVVKESSSIGTEEVDHNIGRMITSDLVENLKNWSSELGCQPFSIRKQSCQHINLLKNKFQSSSKVEISPDVVLIKNGQDLANIDLGRYLNLVELSLGSNKLTSISLVGLVHLTTLTLYQNLLTEIDLSDNRKLTYLNLAENNIQLIDLTTNIHLNFIDLQLNKLSLICLWISTRISAFDHLKKYLFCSQRSPHCQLQVLHNKADKQLCKQVISLWKKHYQQTGKNVNDHICKYAYFPISRD